MRADSAHLGGQSCDLFAEVLDDAFFVSNSLGVGHFFLPLHILLSQKRVLTLKGSEGALETEEAVACTVDFTQSGHHLIDLKASGVNSKSSSNLIEAREEAAKFSVDGRVAFEVFGDDSEFTFQVFELSLGEGEVLTNETVSFKSLVGDGLGFFNLEIGSFDHISHGEALFENGVDDHIVIVSPGLAEAEELVVLTLLV